MTSLKSVPLPTKEDATGWVVGLVSGERIFIKAQHLLYDETSLTFHNGVSWNTFTVDKDLVIQFERLHIMWLMPNRDTVDVLISEAPSAEGGEYEDESED